MDWLRLIPLIISSAANIKSLIDIATSNADLTIKLRQAVPYLIAALEQYAAALFPRVKPELRIAAAAMAAFDPNVTKWLQAALNALLDPSPGLAIDGIYGPRTRDAVEKFQDYIGFIIDGWAGTETQAAIQNALAERK